MGWENTGTQRTRTKPSIWMAAVCAAVAIALTTMLGAAAPADAFAAQNEVLTTSATKAVTVGKAKIAKIKAGAEKITVTFKKGANATKSQVAYKKAGAKKWTKVNAGTKTKVVLKKLTGAKKYTVKVRSYKKVDGKTYYGKWSAVKTAKPTISSKLIGTWEIESAKTPEQEATATQFAMVKLMGINFTLTVKKNGTAVTKLVGADKVASLAGDKLEGIDPNQANQKLTWSKKTAKSGVFKIKGVEGSVTMKYVGGKLVYAEEGMEAVFKKA